jgi:hypothetical protein
MLQLQLIKLYYYICHCYDKHLCLHYQRQSNNYQPLFTDQEVLTIYIFGMFQKRFTVKDIYNYTVNHWQDWFPDLPSYQGYNYRLNQLYWHFEVIINELMRELSFQDCYVNISLTDSLPIILSTRPYQAKVAREVADKGYCSTKKLYYHGIRLHLLGFDRYKHMPMPEYMGFTAASENDLTVLKSILPHLKNRKIIGDKIFASAPLNQQIATQHLEIITPVKLKKKQKFLEAADKMLSSFVSSVRQPVESFFNWLIEKTAIQTACKVRSEKGLWVHCYGRLTAALFILAFNS